MQSAYHNLPSIDGIMQNAGREFAARAVNYRADSSTAVFSLDIAKAYPPEAGVRSWLRTVRLGRARNEITIIDRCSLSKDAARITLTLMTPCKVRELASGELKLDGRQAGFGQARVFFEGARLKPKVEEISITDARLKNVWGERVYRILLLAERPAREANWTTRIVK